MKAFGREYRKLVSQGIAYVAFRWVAIWILVAACVRQGEAGRAVALGIIALDICVTGLGKALVFHAADQRRTDWFERLTNRIFYQKFWEEVQAGNAQYIDVDELFKQATRGAAADIKKADENDREVFGFLDRTGWHWLGGVISFVGLSFWLTIYYGSAWVLGLQ